MGSCSEIAQTAWAFGKVSVHEYDLFNALAQSAVPRLRSFKKQELSDLHWGCSAIGFYEARLFGREQQSQGIIAAEAACAGEGGVAAVAETVRQELKLSASPVAPQDQMWVCSVKNTFIEVDLDNSSSDSDAELLKDVMRPLSPSLNIIPHGIISPEKLTAYRLEYQRFRAGAALGAKGELCSGVV